VLYRWYELNRAAMRPARFAAGSCGLFFNNPLNPLAHTVAGRHAAAACALIERTTRRYARPEFGIESTKIDGKIVGVSEETVWQRPFCRLVHFKRQIEPNRTARDPRILVVAPMSGHFATLLRGTVETLLPEHEVFITDWHDARGVAQTQGSFDLDDYILYLREMLRHLGGDVHLFAVCQPAAPALAAVALMEEEGDANVPTSLILAGGPVDTRINPTAVNRLAEQRGTKWFRDHVIAIVPWPNAGAGRAVYPGFLQLSGFMSMNADRHFRAHSDYFMHLVQGDRDSAANHSTFYDEYLAVMDLTAEFYLQTIDSVFVRQALPQGEMRHRARSVDLGAIRRVPLMTIEGENDDITGAGQCRAALDLCRNVPRAMKLHYTCAEVGHYGVFNGSRFRLDIAPRVAQFVRTHDRRARPIFATTARLRDASAARAPSQSRDISHAIWATARAGYEGLRFFANRAKPPAEPQAAAAIRVSVRSRERPKRRVLELVG